MGARRGLMNQMLRKVEAVHNMPAYSLRSKLGEARRDEAGLFNHYWHNDDPPKGLRSFEDRTDAEDAYTKREAPLYRHDYHPTEGWRVQRI